MDNTQKILFLENLLDMASKTLKKFKQASKFFLCEGNVYDGFRYIGTDTSSLCKVNLDEDSHFNFVIDLGLRKKLVGKHSIKRMFSKWKKTNDKDIEDVLLKIISQMEEEVANGWTLGLKLPWGSEVPGIILWHAKTPIEQLAIELDVMA